MAVLVVLMAVLGAAPGDEVQPTGLRWSAPPECPAEEAFVAALQFRTTRAQIVSADAAPTAWIEVHLTKVGKKFRGALKLELPTGLTQREVTSPKCASVIEALSLMSALVIDPEHAKLGPLPAELPPVEVKPVEPPPVVEPPPPAPVVEVKPEPPPALPLVVAEPARVPAEVPQAFRLGASAHLTTAISGLADVGGGLTVSFERGNFVVALSGGAGSGNTVATANGTGVYALHGLAALSAGAFLRLSLVRLELLAVAQAFFFSVSAPQAVEPVESLRWLPSVGPAAQVKLSLGPVEAGVGVLVGFNVRRDTYVIDPQGGVFTNPLVLVQPNVSVSMRL